MPALAVLLLVACQQSSAPVASHSSSPSPSPNSLHVPAAGGTGACAAAPSYGLLISGGSVQLISPQGCVVASAPIRPPSVGACTQGFPSYLQPPVSATRDKVYYRDGDTRIRYLMPDGTSGDATTVPGGPTTVSFFSVSPDDQRIAVMVENISSEPMVGLRLYVEDLSGGGHHSVIFTATVPKEASWTFWPMGWHAGSLVLATVPVCTTGTAVDYPNEWYVVSAATGVRSAAIGTDCFSALMPPSPAGVACDYFYKDEVRVFDWSNKLVATIPDPRVNESMRAQLSPGGQAVFVRAQEAQPIAQMLSLDRQVKLTVQGHGACEWIDDSTILAPDAVIAYPSGNVTPLPAAGACVGRFPGGL